MSFTIKEALNRASFQLGAGGLDAPRREAEALLCACLDVPLAYLYAHGNEIIPKEKLDRYFNWTSRRARGEPYAYLCGQREFLGRLFFVTPDVLIPRPETELLVEAVAAELAGIPSPRVLDVGTGSGIIAVSLACLLPGARVTAVDLSAPALAVAARNASRHGVASRVKFLQGDFYAPLAGLSERFTAVVSNPPYIRTADIPGLLRDVRDYEPLLALDGGPDGLAAYRRLTGELDLFACRPQLLAFEVGEGQAPAVTAFCRSAGYGKTRLVKDLAGIERVVLASL